MNKEINILAEELRKVAVDFVESSGFSDEIKPYPGLRPFEYKENYLFFGREGKAQEIALRLQQSHFVAVVGTSGSGKSSVVRAGLLPLLYGGMLYESGSNWRIAIMRPEETPIHNLAEAMVYPADFEREENSCEEPRDETQIGITEATLRRSGVGLLDFINNPVNNFAEDENLLIVVDQFEELFRFKGKYSADFSEEAVAFVKLLLEGTRDEKNRIFVVITMRSDFLGDCAQFQGLPEAINEGQYLIPQMTREQLRQSIESPALVGGAEVSPALVNRLLNDLDDDQTRPLDASERMVRDYLPVLQHALMRTWDFWKNTAAPGTLIDIEHYEAIGSIKHALSMHADEAYNELSDDQKITAEKMFKCLTETDSENREIRRPAKIEEIRDVIGINEEEIYKVIDVFRKEGRTFLMPPFNVALTKDTKIDISHESLIRNWEMLKGWVKAEAENSWLYRRVSEDARVLDEYIEKNRDILPPEELEKNGKDFLWRGIELKDALKWRDNFLPNVAWASRYQALTDNEKLELSEITRSAPEKEPQKRKEFMQLHFDHFKKYLSASAQNEAEEQAEKERNQEMKIALERQKTEAAEQIAKVQQDKMEGLRTLTESLKRQRRNLIIAVAFSVILMLVSIISSIIAWSNYKTAEAAKIKAEDQTQIAETAKNEAIKQRAIALDEKQNAEEQKNIADEQKKRAEEQKQAADKQKQIAENETERAKKQTKIAETEKNNAETQRKIAETTKADLEKSNKTLETAQGDLIESNKTLTASLKQSELNINGLTAFENYDYKSAADNFAGLESEFRKTTDNNERNIWWANYNIAKSYQQLGQYKNAEKYFDIADRLLPSDQDLMTKNDDDQRLSPFNLVNISYNSAQSSEVGILKKSKLITLRKFAQFYRNCAVNPEDCFNYENNNLDNSDTDPKNLNVKAVKLYERLINIKEPNARRRANMDDKDKIFLADVKKELADVFLDLNLSQKAEDNYESALAEYDSLGQAKQPLTIISIRQKLLEAKIQLDKLPEAEAQTVLIVKKKEEFLEKSIEKDKVPLDKSMGDTYAELSIIYRKYGVKAIERYLEKVRSFKAERLKAGKKNDQPSRQTQSNPEQTTNSKNELSPEEQDFFSVLENDNLVFNDIEEGKSVENFNAWQLEIWDKVKIDYRLFKQLNSKANIFSRINSRIANLNDNQSKDPRERFELSVPVMFSYLRNDDRESAKKILVVLEKSFETMVPEGDEAKKIQFRREIFSIIAVFNLKLLEDYCATADYTDKWLNLVDNSSSEVPDSAVLGTNMYLIAGSIFSSCENCPEDIRKARRILTTYSSFYDMYEKDVDSIKPYPFSNKQDGFDEQIKAQILIGQSYETEKNFGEAARIYNELLSKIPLWKKNNPPTLRQFPANTSFDFSNSAVNDRPVNSNTAVNGNFNRPANSNAAISVNSNTFNGINTNTKIDKIPKVDDRFSFYEAYLNVRLAELNLTRDESIAKKLPEKNTSNFAELRINLYTRSMTIFSRNYAIALKNIGDYFRERDKVQAIRYYQGASKMLEYIKSDEDTFCQVNLGGYCRFYSSSKVEEYPDVDDNSKLSSKYYEDYIDVLGVLKALQSDQPEATKSLEDKIKDAVKEKNTLAAKETETNCRFNPQN